ncbi:hypothetical protein MNBD_PLANCTO03-1425 [hydrothermal vent metagenome]|uniref:Uncharacterized protein n=1 Tax=hydrothermal vent metagenome TaxID=652676 RepID=A0A3B1DV13_9ZZZZ
MSPAKAPEPLPPPLPAENLHATLLHSGALRLDWEGTTAHGTCYTLWRRLDPNTPASLLGAVCLRSFVDETLPAGTPEAVYFVRTHRGELTSDDSTHITVRLGVTGQERTAHTTPALPGSPLASAA